MNDANDAARTYVVVPDEAVHLGVGPHLALKVDVVALLDLVRLEGGAHLDGDERLVWKHTHTHTHRPP